MPLFHKNAGQLLNGVRQTDSTVHLVGQDEQPSPEFSLQVRPFFNS